jgi:hypothetical protein
LLRELDFVRDLLQFIGNYICAPPNALITNLHPVRGDEPEDLARILAAE